MARTTQVAADPTDFTAINLRRALIRLEHKILTSPDPRLARSSFERTKTSASRKQERQKTLLAQRALIKRLTERLHYLDSQDSDAYSSESEGEDLLGEHAQSAPSATTSTPAVPSNASLGTRKPEDISPEYNLRNRLNPSTLPTSPSGTSTALPPNTTAQQLESHSTEQLDLTSSMVSLVAQLKSSTLAFSSSLDLDTEALARAQEGLEKNESGLDAAGKRMGTLRKMSEGKGLWGRMMLYAWIGSLWIVAILLVFVGPKLRF
ncbi:MAG: hypothetical protein Q9201_001003 [Fulgogasparrea decipioides]